MLVLDSPVRVLATAVALHDPLAHPGWATESPEWRSRQQCADARCIRDVDAFAQAQINRFQRPNARRAHRIELSDDMRDELAHSIIAILYDLHRTYKPHMDGYEKGGSFSGYASVFAARKGGDAWHRLCPEHQLRTQVDGGRRWIYGEKTVSLEALTAEDPDRHAIMASAGTGHDFGPRIHAAWQERSRIDLPWIVEVAKLIGAGVSPAAVGDQLGITEDMVRRYMRSIVRAAPTPDHQFVKVTELRAALQDQAERDAELASRVGDLLCDGATVADAAEILEIEASEVRDYQDVIRMVWHAIEGGGGGE